MERFRKLSFPVGKHRVEARQVGDGTVEVRVDGSVRAEVRLSEMLGGFTFALGERGQHRVDLLHIAGSPERLEALVGGHRFGAVPPPRPAGAAGATALLVGVGALVAVLGALGGFLELGSVVRFGFGRISVIAGSALLALGPFVWRRQRWAAVAAVLVQGAAAAVILARLVGAGAPLGAGVLLAQGIPILLLLGVPLWIWLRPQAPAVPAQVPSGGGLGVRCAEHVDLAAVPCAHCGRPLCARCPAYRQGDRLLCGPCGEG